MGEKKKTQTKKESQDTRPPRRRDGVKRFREDYRYTGKIKKPKGEYYTLKQRVFIQEYLKTGNATEAYRIAYDGKDENAGSCAYNLIHQPKIAKAINEILEAAEFTDEYAAQTLKKIVDAGSSEGALVQASPAHALAGLRLFAQMRGLTEPKSGEKVKDELEKVIARKTISQLKEEINQLDKRQAQLMNILQGNVQEAKIQK